jgi:hypothetical protein
MTEELAVRLQGAEGDALKQELLQRLHAMQAALLQKMGGGGIGVAWVTQLAAQDVQSIQAALVAVRAAIDILQTIQLSPTMHNTRN